MERMYMTVVDAWHYEGAVQVNGDELCFLGLLRDVIGRADGCELRVGGYDEGFGPWQAFVNGVDVAIQVGNTVAADGNVHGKVGIGN